MISESAPAVAPPLSGPPPDRFKIRLRFGKGFDLRLLSHKDLLRAFERLFRRAEVPIAHSQGFNPHPRIVFALSLPLGVVGHEEVADIELDRPWDLDELRQRILPQAPPGLTFHEFTVLAPKASAQVAGLCYRLPVPDDRVPVLRASIPELLSRPSCVVKRPKAPGQRIDLRPSIVDLRLVEIPDAGALPGLASVDRSAWHHSLELELRPAQVGTARPEEVFALLGVPDLLDCGGVLERTRLRLVDELPNETSEGTPCPRSC
jgi:radical SAM-linked protein